MKPYVLRIMAPGATEDTLIDFVSDTPFGTVSKGDLLELEQVRGRPGGDEPILRVVNVEHKIYQTDTLFRHAIRVFTEEAPNAPSTRLKR
jgi:hypothetical protein